MDVKPILDSIRSRPDFNRVGMILVHHGVVRGTSKDGRPVSGLTLSKDEKRLAEIIAKEKISPGIVDIRIEITDRTELVPGDDLMIIAVAGDIRENVIPALGRTLNAVKKTVTKKEEHLKKRDTGKVIADLREFRKKQSLNELSIREMIDD